MYHTNTGDNLFVGTLGTNSRVVSTGGKTVKRIFWGGSFVGTFAVYDSATVAGTSLANEIIAVGLPLTRYPESIELNYRGRNGIVVTETGTPNVKLVWGE